MKSQKMCAWVEAIARSPSLTSAEARALCRERSPSPHQRLALQRYHLSELFSLSHVNEHNMHNALKLARPKLLLREVTASCFQPEHIPQQRVMDVWDKVMQRPSTDVRTLSDIVKYYRRLGFLSSLFSTTTYSSCHTHVYHTREELQDIPCQKLYELTLIQTSVVKVGDFYAVRLISPWMLEMVDSYPHLKHISEVDQDYLERSQRRFWKVQEQYQTYFACNTIVHPRLIGDE